MGGVATGGSGVAGPTPSTRSPKGELGGAESGSRIVLTGRLGPGESRRITGNNLRGYFQEV